MIDRDCFGHWLSGFADGEAHFSLRLLKQSRKRYEQPCAFFRIALRDDDLPILESIQKYWGCGKINRFHNQRSKVSNAKPYATFQVTGRVQLSEVVVPHFDKFPLRSKKQNEFIIWKAGIQMMENAAQRPDTYRRTENSVRVPKWSGDEREHFQFLVDLIQATRRYKGQGVTPHP